jgi:hypothetical protein
MKKHLSLLISAFLAGTCFIAAQNPVKNHREDVMQIKGKWTRLPNIENNHDPSFPKNQYSFAYKRMDSLTAMLKYAYPDPTGIEAEYYSGVSNYPITSKTPFAYMHSSLYKVYYFNENINKIILGDETSTWVRFYVNFFGWFFHENIGRYIVDGKEVSVFSLYPRDGTWKGLPVYRKPSYRGERTVLISRDGELPIIPITQKQFLVNLRKQLGEKQKKSLEGDKQHEKFRLQEIEKAKNGTYPTAAAKEKAIASAQFYYEQYMTRRSSRLPWEEKEYNKNLNLIDDYLASHSEQELAQPVKTPGAFEFNGSFEPRKKDAPLVELVRINFAYFKPNLPKYVPQFIAMYWTWGNGNGNAPELEFKRQLEENFPLERLKRMLDK